ncbi:putative bifunctional diguanylate cyclase/phosphodiesterase [Pseudarthrobacter sp. NPDC092439]|uniref:putative bifunctional diguanylate cyclase/phosphodiesterase n=1 Tax=unclassified Pseudarthrobacter TaxID=2647000 RepID=UPI003825F2B0
MNGPIEGKVLTAQALEAVLDISPDALLVVAADGTVAAANAAAGRLFGIPEDNLAGLDHRSLLAGDFREDIRKLFRRLLARPDLHPAPVQTYCLHRTGTEFPAELTASFLPGAGRQRSDTGQLLLSVRSTAHHSSAAPRREAMALLAATLESTADGILVVDSDWNIAGYNEKFLAMWGIPEGLLEGPRDITESPQTEVMQLVLDQLQDPLQFMARLGDLESNPAAESHDVLEFKDGRTIERYSRPHRSGDEILGRVWSFQDITPRRQAQERANRAMADLAAQTEKLRGMAFRDPLTGLANRAVFNDALAEALRSPRLKSVDVLLLDLDDFKEVNDILGHQAGDDMLIEVARRLRGCAPTADVVARLGGDEFVVLLTACPNADEIATCMVRCLRVPLTVGGTVLRPSLSLGLASMTSEDQQAPELLRRADIAMYAAKAAGKNRFLRFQPDMMTELVQRTAMESGLLRATEHGEISVDFQPIVSCQRGQVVTFEALARWDRDGGRVPPSVFIPLAERTGLISGIGTEVTGRAMLRVSGWLAGDPSRSLAVNVSGVQLQEHDFAEQVLRLAEASGVAPYQLVIEVTESVFFDADCSLVKQLSTLREAGARVALDDFGTGYSSLGRLQELPVDTVKIDKSFVSMIRTGRERLPILSSMINMAHSLGLTVTAEGIETIEQANYLAALECDSMQGYLFSRPEPGHRLHVALSQADEVLRALKEQ